MVIHSKRATKAIKADYDFDALDALNDKLEAEIRAKVVKKLKSARVDVDSDEADEFIDMSVEEIMQDDDHDVNYWWKELLRDFRHELDELPRIDACIKADEEADRNGESVEDVEVAPEAADLLFEAEDVAQLLSEVTQQPVDVDTADDGASVEFTVGEDVYTVEAEGDEEVLESVRKPIQKKKAVKASRQLNRNVKKPVRQIRRK